MIRHHLDSFNEFTDIRIEQIVKQSNPLLIFNNYDEKSNTYKYEIQINFKDTYLQKPFIYENNGSTKIMYPKDVGPCNITYSGQLLMDLTIDIYKNEGDEKIKVNAAKL